ncbi:hypothetical protein CEXT_182951 [Caerostris extrusa]|uniref:Uncharacterized protein n=1 Tax=Caerostris extrusa TaxID=172846 RepID=A0AAV4RRD6_CAEEX|nr:hypothetical protein CEXT_182951 [Caerostris extrusa]
MFVHQVRNTWGSMYEQEEMLLSLSRDESQTVGEEMSCLSCGHQGPSLTTSSVEIFVCTEHIFGHWLSDLIGQLDLLFITVCSTFERLAAHARDAYYKWKMTHL